MGDVERIKGQWRSQNAGGGGGSVRDGSKTSLKDRLATMSKKSSGSSSPPSAVTSFRKELRKGAAPESPKTPKSIKRLESDAPIASSGSRTARTASDKSQKMSGDSKRTASGSMTERLPRTASTSSRRPSLARSNSDSRRGSLSISRRGSLTKSPTSPTSPPMSEKQKRKKHLLGTIRRIGAASLRVRVPDEEIDEWGKSTGKSTSKGHKSALHEMKKVMALDSLGDMLSALRAQMKEEARAEEEDPELQMAPEAKIVERTQWACERGLLPRPDLGMPVALEDKISKETCSVMAKAKKQSTDALKSSHSPARFLKSALSAATSPLRTDYLDEAPMSPSKEIIPAEVPKSRYLYFTFECRGLRGIESRTHRTDSFLVLEVMDSDGVWTEHGHTEIVNNESFPVYQENLKVPCNEGSEEKFDTIRISAYHYKAHQPKKAAALADTFAMAFTIQREDSHQLFGGPKPCALCGSAGMTHFADHGRPVNCESKVLLGVAEFKLSDLIEAEGMRRVQRFKGDSETDDMSVSSWSRKAYQRVRDRLLVLSDQGHQMGDIMTGVYKQFDTGGAGTIDPFEFSTALSAFNSRPSTQKQGTELFSMVDLNGDGEIDYLEFQRWVRGGCGNVSVKAEFGIETDKFFSSLWDEYTLALKNQTIRKTQEDKGKSGSRASAAVLAEQLRQLTENPDWDHEQARPEPTMSEATTCRSSGSVPYYWYSERPGTSRSEFKALETRKGEVYGYADIERTSSGGGANTEAGAGVGSIASSVGFGGGGGSKSVGKGSMWGHVQSTRRANAFIGLLSGNKMFGKRFTSGMTAGENLKIERRPMLGEISRLDVPAGGGDGKGSHGSASKRVATHVKRKVDPVRIALLQQYDMWSKERDVERERKASIKLQQQQDRRGSTIELHAEHYTPHQRKFRGLGAEYNPPEEYFDIGDDMFEALHTKSRSPVSWGPVAHSSQTSPTTKI